MICNLCNYESSGKDFSNHLQREHKLKSREYTIKHIYKIQPHCESCGSETRYVAFKFKRFCKGCSKIASSVSGKEGGKATAWNKGKTKETDTRLKKQATKMSGEGNPFYGRQHSIETRQRISNTKTLNRITLQSRVSERSKEFNLLTRLGEYSSRQKQYLKFECKKCLTISEKTLQAFERGSLCPVCHPLGTSQGENEIFEFIKSLSIENIKRNDRIAINPKEIDILIQDYNIAIEFNGLYWHSNNGRNSLYDMQRHIQKTESCAEKDISLIHIFSDEWRDKQDICKSMISHRLGKTQNRIHARKCKVVKVSKEQERLFFSKNHISGFVPSRECFGLSYNNEIVAVISLRIPRQKKYKGMIEIARFSTKLNNHISGGLSRLMKEVKEYAIDSCHSGILTYADRRFGEGKGYLSSGFVLGGSTGLDYWYTDGQIRLNRFSVRADKHETEKEKAFRLNLTKIHGCGSNIYILSN